MTTAYLFTESDPNPALYSTRNRVVETSRSSLLSSVTECESAMYHRAQQFAVLVMEFFAARSHIETSRDGFPIPRLLRQLDGFTVAFSGLGKAYMTRAIKPALMVFTVTRGKVGDERDKGTRCPQQW